MHDFLLKKLHSTSMTISASFGLYGVRFHCMSNASYPEWVVLETIKPWRKYITFSLRLMLLSVHMCLDASVPVWLNDIFFCLRLHLTIAIFKRKCASCSAFTSQPWELTCLVFSFFVLVYTPEVSVCLHELYQCLQELNCSSSMASSMTSSNEADLTQVIPLLVDGIAQEIGAERRDMRVTFVADHQNHDLSSWSQLKYQLMPETSFVWQRPNDLNHPRAYFEISLANEQLLMNPINTTNECVPKDIKGSGAYTDPGQPARLWQAGSYGSALSTLRTKLLAAMEG